MIIKSSNSWWALERLGISEFGFYLKTRVRPMSSSLLMSKSRFDPGSGTICVKTCGVSRETEIGRSFWTYISTLREILKLMGTSHMPKLVSGYYDYYFLYILFLISISNQFSCRWWITCSYIIFIFSMFTQNFQSNRSKMNQLMLHRLNDHAVPMYLLRVD